MYRDLTLKSTEVAKGYYPMVNVRVLLFSEGYFCFERKQKFWRAKTKVFVMVMVDSVNYYII